MIDVFRITIQPSQRIESAPSLCLHCPVAPVADLIPAAGRVRTQMRCAIDSLDMIGCREGTKRRQTGRTKPGRKLMKICAKPVAVATTAALMSTTAMAADIAVIAGSIEDGFFT